MPGTNLNLTLPSLSDSLATIVSKTATALSAIQNDLAPKVTAGELNINAALPFNGNAATGLGSIQLSSGNTPTAAGSIYYLNGEFYAIDSTGTVQLTTGGAINAAGIGGIVGDYGGVNPAKVTYVNSGGQYQFTISPGVWATVVAGNLLLEGTNGTVQLGVDAAITGAKLLNYKSFPSSGVSFMVYNAATSTVEDGGVTHVSNPLVSSSTIQASGLTATGTVTGASLSYTADETILVPASAAVGQVSTNASWAGGAGLQLWYLNSGHMCSYPLVCRVGDTITGYKARAYKTSVAGIVTARLYKMYNDVELAQGVGTSSSANGPGDISSVLTETGLAIHPVAGEAYYLALTSTNGGTSDWVISVEFYVHH